MNVRRFLGETWEISVKQGMRIIVGFAPEDVNLKVHVVGSAGFLLGNVGSVLVGLACWRTIRWKAIVSVGIGVIGTLSSVLLLETPQLGIGLLERLASYPLTLWLVVLGLEIILSRGGARPSLP